LTEVLDELIEANDAFARSFDARSLPMSPGRGLAVLVCMDARIDPAKAIGLAPGDAHVIRNAGGRASDDAIRSLIISSRLQGTREFVVIHHSDCGMLAISNDDLRAKLQEETGVDASAIDFLPIDDLEASVREDVDRIRSSPFIDPAIRVSGWTYDVRNGSLKEVVSAQA
jgi:carbonic anhydrase